MNNDILLPFRKEIKLILDILNNKNKPLKHFVQSFHLIVNFNLLPSQSFNFWKVSLRCHGFFQQFNVKRKICIALLDKCGDLINIEEVLIFLTFYYPKLGITLINAAEFFQKEQCKNRKVQDKIQNDAESICLSLRKYMPKDCIFIIGLTETELYYQDAKFVLGQSFFNYKSSVICLGKKFDVSSDNRFMLTERVMKSVFHETAHLFGLQHCRLFECLMNESNSIIEALRQPFSLCPLCLTKLQYLMTFDIFTRYESLLCYVNNYLDSVSQSSNIYSYRDFLSSILNCSKIIK